MSTKTELRDQVLAEMNARRIDHKTYINSEWLLSEYEKALDAETNTMSTKTDEEIIQPILSKFDLKFIDGSTYGAEELFVKELLDILTTLRKEQEEAVAEAYEKGQMESRLSEHKERLDLWDEAITEGRRRERLGILNVLDGSKEVYTADAKTEDGETYALKGEEKEHSDSERNETIDEVIEALTPQNTKTDPSNAQIERECSIDPSQCKHFGADTVLKDCPNHYIAGHDKGLNTQSCTLES